MTFGDFLDLLFICAGTWLGPLLVSLLACWLLILQVNLRARLAVWAISVGWSAFSLWYLYATHRRTSRPFPYDFDEYVQTIGLWVVCLLGLLLMGMTEWLSARELHRIAFLLQRPEDSEMPTGRQ